MSDTLLIHYNIEDKDHANWSLCNDEGELTCKICSGSLPEIHELALNHKPIVLLSSQCLHINELELPTKNMQKMLRAVPFAVEEFIADDIENIHFVISSKKTDKMTSVVGINKSTLQSVINNFQQANIKIDTMIPDTLCLAADNQQWAALNFQDNTYLQTNALNGTMTSHEILPYILESKLSDEDLTKPEKILLFCESENDQALDDLSLSSSNIEPIKITYNTHPLVIFCGNYKQALPLNLLQHDFKIKSQSSVYWKYWRSAAALAGIWLLLHLGFTTYQYNQLKEENILTKNKIEKIYKTAFPKSRKINNARRQMEQKIKTLKSASGNSNSGLLYMLKNSFADLKQETKDITFQSITYRNNRMDVQLDSKNLQAIENINKKLNTNNAIKSAISSSSSEKNKVKGNLRIEARS